MMFDLLLSTFRHLHAERLSLRLTGTASRWTTYGSTRKTACSGPSSARTPPTATRLAALRSWATAVATRAWPISEPACWASSTPFPSREPTSTSPWIWPATRSQSLWCDRGRDKATPGWPFHSSVSDVGMIQTSGNETREEVSILGSKQQKLVSWQHVGCPSVTTSNMETQ